MSKGRVDRPEGKPRAEGQFRRPWQPSALKTVWTQDPALDWGNDLFSCPVIMLKIVSSLG